MRKLLSLFLSITILLLGTASIANSASSPSYQADDIIPFKVDLPTGSKYGYMLIATGKWVIPPQFESASGFNKESHLATVKFGDKYGFIDLSGNIVIAPQFDEVGWLWSDGLLNVRIGDQWGFIDKRGRYSYTAPVWSCLILF